MPGIVSCNEWVVLAPAAYAVTGQVSYSNVHATSFNFMNYDYYLLC